MSEWDDFRDTISNSACSNDKSTIMTKEQQRIAIAEWMGWDVIKDTSDAFKMGRMDGVNGGDWARLPNYPEDLNDMHEAEKKLTALETIIYMRHLCKNAMEYNEDNSITVDEARAMCFATASQRSEALCRTLWPERFQ